MAAATPAAADDAGENRSVSVVAKRALPIEEAYAEIAGEDRRPLLVLRECLTCTGTDDALMTRNADNEKTMIMARWFHCVKLPPAVTESDHPFYALFENEETHLFLARWDGTERVELDGAQSRVELWKHMEELLASEYEKKHTPALKAMSKLLNELDELDTKVARLRSDLEDVLEKDGPGSRKVAKLEKKLAKYEQEKAEVVERAAEVSVLPLKEPEPEHAGLANGRDGAA